MRPWPLGLTLQEREVEDADYEPLWRLHADTMRSYVSATYGPWDDGQQRRFFQNGWQDRRASRLLVDSGVVVASWLVERRADALFLSFIEVAPPYQGRGIGTVIVERLLEEAAAARLPARLMVMRANPRARRLYERLGFAVEAETATHFR